MKTHYSGYYRTCLSSEEKKRFKRLALRKGSVLDIHDRLLREFIRKEERQEGLTDERT